MSDITVGEMLDMTLPHFRALILETREYREVRERDDEAFEGHAAYLRGLGGVVGAELSAQLEKLQMTMWNREGEWGELSFAVGLVAGAAIARGEAMDLDAFERLADEAIGTLDLRDELSEIVGGTAG